MVVSYFLLLGVETDALADYGGWGAVVAPYGEGEFEADGQDALGDLVGAFAERVRGVVEARGVRGVRRVVPPHVEALHRGGWGREVCATCAGSWWWTGLLCE